MKTLSITILFFLCRNVNYGQLLTDRFVHEIVALDSDEKKEAYLLQINQSDQKVRHDLHECERYKDGSLECAELRQKAQQTDLENLVKVAMYLRVHGYPSQSKFSSETSSTPWLVLHHTVGLVKNWDKEFAPYLVKAWQKNDITTVNLHWYLKWYFNTYMGHPYQRTTATNENEDITELIKLLKIKMD
jgi:hypothetical protein